MAVLVSVRGLTPSLLLGIMWAGVSLAIIFTILRTMIRFHVSHRLFLDDFFVYFSLAVLIAMGVLYTLITNFMFELALVSDGEMKPTLQFLVQAPFFLKSQFAIILLFWTSLWSVKFSILLFYRKLFTGPSLRWWWAVIVFTSFAYVGCWITQLLSCKPISSYFTLGTCETGRDIFVSNFSLYYATVVDIVCDLFIMALPLHLLWGLKITTRQKLALAGIFSLGIVIIIFAIVRVIETSASTHHVNPIWLSLWSMIEASIAVIIANLPSFRVIHTTRHPSAYRNSPADKNSASTPSTNNSRFSRFSRLSRGNSRDVIPLAPVSTADLPASPLPPPAYTNRPNLPPKGPYRHHMNLSAALGDVSKPRPTGHFAAAEGLPPPVGHDVTGWYTGSEEEILPKDTVHVRSEFYMTSEAV